MGDLIKENVGSQDQTIASFGGFNKIEFKSARNIEIHPVTLDMDKIDFFQQHIMMFFSGFSRTASEIAKTQIENTKNRVQELTQMHQMVDEGIRILKEDKGLEEFGRLLNETWQIKKGLSDKITTPEIDAMYEKAKKAGAFGGKLLGAGGGGFLLLLIPQDKQESVRQALQDFLEVSFHFENNGSQIIYKNHKA